MSDKLLKFIHKYWKINAIILFISAFFVFPAFDSYYYWTWSQHLQLSYFDGPPMIAYLLWLSTHIFGNNFFSINLISILCIYCSSFLIYKIVSLFSDKSTAKCAAILWMVFPFTTTRFIAVSMTLDGLEVFFSLLIVYATFNWMKFRQTRDVYFIGIAIGLGLLAKYNVVILVIGLMAFFMLNKDLRKIYFSPHLYIAAVIALAIFSPVLIWNYQNNWASFNYQLNSHKWTGDAGAINSASKHGLRGMWFYVGSCVFGVLHILLLLMGYFKFIKKTSIPGNAYNKCIGLLIWVILLFWLYKSYSSHVGLNYMVTVSCFLAIVLGQQLIQMKQYKFIQVLLLLFSVITVIMLIDKSHLHPKHQDEVDSYTKYVTSGLIHRPFIGH